MTRPSTIAALAAIVCAPALAVFAEGRMTGFALAVWYLAALVVLAVGLHLVMVLWSHYDAEATEHEQAARRHAGAELPGSSLPDADSQSSRQTR